MRLPIKKAWPGDLEVDSHISVVEVAEVVNSSEARIRGVNKIHLQYLKAPDVVGHDSATYTRGSAPLDWQTGVMVPLFKKRETTTASSASLVRYIQRY